MSCSSIDLSFVDELDRFSSSRRAFNTSSSDDVVGNALAPIANSVAAFPLAAPHRVRVLEESKKKQKQQQQQMSSPLTQMVGGFEPQQYENAMEGAIKYAHGTTTLGFVFNGGVLIAVDSRASMGSYIGSGTVKKVIEINDYLLGTMAGGAADCSFWERHLARQCRMYELRNNERISIAAASKLLANTFYGYRGRGLSCGTMIAGWDKRGPSLYYIDDDGTRLKGNRFSVGSGSTYAYGVLDSFYKEDLTREEAVELGKRAIYHATHRDAYSGGTINVYLIEEKGWTKMFSNDMNFLHYGQYTEERRAAEQQ